MNQGLEELYKIIGVKKADIEECIYELQNCYHPVVVRLALTDYIEKLQKELESYNEELIAVLNDLEVTP
ncbi:hypothetical protein [Neobacillus fumarioli]|uniref:hypothetical protein n=1 Tax=Neobacillus fumarioli TaxID=105229 RepID=UPI00082D2B66|nr:hypothetical protein [Neobacillus fumarioli]